MAEKVTMELEVDLECHRCYKKVKKILCKIPEIQDPKYNEKENKVTITVISCRPEKIRDKLYCKGKGCIRCIKIIVPKKEDEEKKKKEEDEKKRKEEEKKKKEEDEKKKKKKKKKEEEEEKEKKEEPVTGYPPMYPIKGVIGICLVPYCEGYGVRGRCNHGYGKRPGALGPCYDGCGCGCGGGVIRPRPPCYDGCGCGCGGDVIRPRPPCHDGCGCGCGCGSGGGFYVNRPCDAYFCEENPRCAIM